MCLTEDDKKLKMLLKKKYPTLMPSDADFNQSIDGGISWDNIPLPGILHFAYCDILGFPASGPEEKVAWVIKGNVFGVNFQIAFLKFGPRLFIEAPCSQDVIGEICSMQIGLYRETKRFLRNMQDLMMQKGNFTVENNLPKLHSEYMYFRQTALEEYEKEPPKPKPVKFDDDGRAIAYNLDPFRPLRIGGYLAKASIISYFSWIEHLLVLLYPLTQSYQSEEMEVFLGKTWREKWGMVFSHEDRKAQKALSILNLLAKNYRNPLAHGGIKRGGEFLAFHLSGAGAVPFLEDDDNLGAEITIAQISEERFKKIISQQDETICLIRQSRLALAWEYVASGLNVAGDVNSHNKYLVAQKSDDAMEEFIAYTSYMEDKYANMDF